MATVLGNTEGTEYQELYLESTRKQNKLLDLEIEMKEVKLEIQRLQLEGIKNQNQNPG